MTTVAASGLDRIKSRLARAKAKFVLSPHRDMILATLWAIVAYLAFLLVLFTIGLVPTLFLMATVAVWLSF